MGTAHLSRDAATGFAAVAKRSRAGCWSMEDRRRNSLINWPYQPKHSASRHHVTREINENSDWSGRHGCILTLTICTLTDISDFDAPCGLVSSEVTDVIVISIHDNFKL